MAKPKENWVDILCDRCGKPSGARRNTHAMLWTGDIAAKCPQCLDLERAEEGAMEKWKFDNIPGYAQMIATRGACHGL